MKAIKLHNCWYLYRSDEPIVKVNTRSWTNHTDT